MPWAAAVTMAAGSAPLDWRVIESEDYRKYIANLRAIHCPEETIRDVIIADVNKLYGSRRAQVEVAQTSRKYWQGDDLRTWDDPVARERQRKINEIEGERKALIKELLGVDYQTEAQKMVGGTAVFDCNNDGTPDTVEIFQQSAETSCCRITTLGDKPLPPPIPREALDTSRGESIPSRMVEEINPADVEAVEDVPENKGLFSSLFGGGKKDKKK